MKSLIIVPMIGLLLTGCAVEPSKNVNGLTVITYSKETQTIAANEMESNSCPTLNTFMNDYSVLRDQGRIK